MNQLFNRYAYVIFGPTKELSLIEQTFITSGSLALINQYNVSAYGWPYTDLYNPPKKDNKAISNLRITFEIQKDLEKKENEGKIEIYNVTRDTWSLLEDINQTYKVYLSVGYGEAKYQLFVGDIEIADYHRKGSDWILTINAKDGQESMQDMFVNRSYNEGTDLKTIMLDMLEKANNMKDVFKKEAKKWIEEKLTNKEKAKGGLSVTGKLTDELQKILLELGASLSIQDDKLQIIWNNSNNENDIISLSPNSGLIESPSKEKESITFKSLLIPTIVPGGLVEINSKSVKDYFRIERVKYSGDTHGNSWECDCEGIRPSNIITDLPTIKFFEVKNPIKIE